MIQFTIDGPTQIIGVGNGNQLSHEPFKANYRKAFNGKCLAIIKSETKKGVLTFTATSKGLESAKISIRVE